jgi:2'-hydroxyisoflavone reductase
MNILILGGTQFIGRQMVQELLAAGHRVSILNRAQSPDDLPPHVERLRGDRDAGSAGLDALTGRAWDVCVDLSGYTPQQVRPAAERLRTLVRRYIFISAVSVYGDPDERPVYETHPRLPLAAEDVTEVTSDTYGPLKVTCENIVQQIYGNRCTLLRPQVVVGPHDQRGRLAYWVQRAMQGGTMLAPGDGSDHVQVIDVRDVARFTQTVIENDLSGSFNLAGPRLTWAAFMCILGAQNLVWVPADIISAAGLTFLELPLFRPERGPRSSLMDVSNDRARAAGLTLTDPALTVSTLHQWLQGRNLPLTLAPEREAELLRAARHTDVWS